MGDTTFRPPDWEIRVTPALNVNKVWVQQLGAVKLDPKAGDDRLDYHFTLQEAFVDKHLWNRTDRFDFDSLRIGIQPFNADFRGFLFESSEPGVRLFGNLYNNRAQYNLAWFGRLNKDTNSGLNNLESWRDDHTVIAIKAPSGTTLEVPDPDEGMEYPQRRYQIYLKSQSGT